MAKAKRTVKSSAKVGSVSPARARRAIKVVKERSSRTGSPRR